MKYECCVFVRDLSTERKSSKMHKNAAYVTKSYFVLVLAPSSGWSHP